MKHYLVILYILSLAVQFTALPTESFATRLVACANNTSGALRMKRRCGKKETLLATSGDFGALNIGVQGQSGTPGGKGPTGPTGAKGPTGAQGAQGNTGPQGDPGPVGGQGAQGDQGPVGDAGPQGAAGLPGTDASPLVINTVTVQASNAGAMPALSRLGPPAGCAAGENVIGGACEVDSTMLELSGSYPVSTTAWRCFFTNYTGAEIPDTTTITVTTKAFCVDLSP